MTGTIPRPFVKGCPPFIHVRCDGAPPDGASAFGSDTPPKGVIDCAPTASSLAAAPIAGSAFRSASASASLAADSIAASVAASFAASSSPASSSTSSDRLASADDAAALAPACLLGRDLWTGGVGQWMEGNTPASRTRRTLALPMAASVRGGAVAAAAALVDGALTAGVTLLGRSSICERCTRAVRGAGRRRSSRLPSAVATNLTCTCGGTSEK